MRRRAWWLRAVAPPMVVGAVIAILATNRPASAAPTLPPKTPLQLIELLAHTHVVGLSGTIVEHAELGLPALPSLAGGRSPATGVLGLVAGTHRMRVWLDAAGRARLQLVDELDETDLVVAPRSIWSYTFSTNRASEIRLPASAPKVTAAGAAAAGVPTPGTLGRGLLTALVLTTRVDAAGTVRIAGRDAYVLQVQPVTNATTIGRVLVDIDAKTGTPLGVQIYARGAPKAAQPSISLVFSSVHFGRVGASRFRFVPPPGAHVSYSDAAKATGRDHLTPYVVGDGWGSMLVVPGAPLPATATNQQPNRQHSQPQSALSILAGDAAQVPGGILLRTSLLNVLAADDGRLLIGAVPATALEKALSTAAPGPAS